MLESKAQTADPLGFSPTTIVLTDKPRFLKVMRAVRSSYLESSKKNEKHFWLHNTSTHKAEHHRKCLYCQSTRTEN